MKIAHRGHRDASSDVLVTKRSPGLMQSPVNWALLGLIIERESYAYELAGRFRDIYGQTLSLSSTSHIYTALGVLQQRELVEQIPGERAGRQPKPNYRATRLGIDSYCDWLVTYVKEDRRREVIFALGVAALANDVDRVADVLERCGEAWRAQGAESDMFDQGALGCGLGMELVGVILDEGRGRTIAARRAAVHSARQRVGAAKASESTGDGPNS